VQSGVVALLSAALPPSGFDAGRYRFGRVWATSADGARVPMSVLMPAESHHANCPLPTLLYGYGAYGFCSDPGWDSERLAVVDGGVAHVIAHVRGGGELGAAWHAAGRRESKHKSADDLVACAEELRRQGLAGALALEGRSAGGLLVGAAANARPDLFCALLASVPFVDPAGTLQDGNQPLTVNEWEEFGNPNEVGGHESVLAVSPVQTVPAATDNGVARDFPRTLLLPALNDARTGFWEAHKYADAIRSEFSASDTPVLVLTDMEGGHFRSADPEKRAQQRALEIGFVVDALRQHNAESG